MRSLHTEDSDVLAERNRIAENPQLLAKTEVLVVDNLHKFYTGKRTSIHAVKGLTFGVPKGQCFGLLGGNLEA